MGEPHVGALNLHLARAPQELAVNIVDDLK